MWNNENLKRDVLYISIMALSIFIRGCDKSSVTAEAKEDQIKKSFAKTLDVSY